MEGARQPRNDNEFNNGSITSDEELAIRLQKEEHEQVLLTTSKRAVGNNHGILSISADEELARKLQEEENKLALSLGHSNTTNAVLQVIDPDEELARKLQDEENLHVAGTSSFVVDDIESIAGPSVPRDTGNMISSSTLYEQISFDDPTDPFPDLHSLFLQFNDQYFNSALSSVEVRWSSKMTLCAGLCRWEAGGYISIRMSEPLLKFRTKKDYIETLLHEMIHAYLFLVGSKKEQDRDAHGEEFLREAKRVSQAAGVNITVFHTFHDEVDHYRKHIWKCTGPCQHRPPYFGLVKRAMNRPPQKADRWWSEHERTCGGSYIKIAGPDMEGDGTSGRKDKGKRRAATDGVGIDGKDGALAKPNEVRRKKPKTDGNNTTDSKVQLKIDDLLFGEKRRS